MQGFNHFDENGNAVMVDVSGKNVTYRTAIATGEIQVGKMIMEAVKEGSVKKGDVLGVARVAGIMGVKRTSDLVPMCHPLPVQKCAVDMNWMKKRESSGRSVRSKQKEKPVWKWKL